jgi:hypothetical protein
MIPSPPTTLMASWNAYFHFSIKKLIPVNFYSIGFNLRHARPSNFKLVDSGTTFSNFEKLKFATQYRSAAAPIV